MLETILTPIAKKLIPEKISFYDSAVHAGFPSPADDYDEKKLDLNEYVVKNKPATFFVRVAGDSMIGAGIFEGDIVVVDRSIKPVSGDIVLGCLDGDFTVKRLFMEKRSLRLVSENSQYEPIVVLEDQDFFVWGVVTFAMHKFKG